MKRLGGLGVSLVVAITAMVATSSAATYPTDRTSTVYATAAGAQPNDLATGDFNGDGFLDIVVLEKSAEQIEIYNNDGAGNFEVSSTVYSVADPSALAVGDLDSDGLNDDIAVSGHDGANGIVTTVVNGAASTLTTTGTEPIRDIAIGQIDGSVDNADDLVWIQDNPTLALVSIFTAFNPGSGDFSAVTPTGASAAIDAVNFSVGEFVPRSDNGSLDIFIPQYVSGFTNNLYLFRNDGRGTYRSSPSITTASGATVLAATGGDLTNDGNADLVVSETSADQVEVAVNNAPTTSGFTFGSSPFTTDDDTTTAANPVVPKISDVDGDGNADVVVSNFASSSIAVLDGDGTGSLASPKLYSLTGQPLFSSGTAVGDFNADGIQDIVASLNASNNFEVLLSNPPVPTCADDPSLCPTTTETTTTSTTNPTISTNTTTDTSTTTSTPTTTTTTTTTPVTPLAVSVSLSKKLKAKALKIKLSSNRTAEFKVTPIIKLGKKKIKLTAKSQTVKAGGSYTFRFKLTGSKKRKVLAYLKSKRKVSISFSISGLSTDGLSSETYNATKRSKIAKR